MHSKDDVSVAVGASDLQTDRIGGAFPITRWGFFFPAAVRATRSATTASKPQDTSPLSFPDSGESVQVRSQESVQKDVIYLSVQEHKRFKHEANSIKGTWYVESDIVSPKELRELTHHHPIQLPVVRGKTPTTNHKDNMQDLFSNILYSPVTLADIGISKQRKELAMQA
jgi:hypothetical protein